MGPDILFFILHKRRERIYLLSLCLLLIQILIIVFFSSCSKNDVEPIPRKEVSVYSEKTITAVSPFKLDMDCDYGNFEFYNWNRKEVKFEITHKVRANMLENDLDNMLEKFKVLVSDEAGKIDFICNYNGKGGKYEDTFSVVRVFMPERPSSVECTLTQGKLKFFDDLDCDLNIDVGQAEVEINRVKGGVKYTGKSGNLRISSGEINSNSSIITSSGNIRIKSDFESPGSYTLNTGAGIIELAIPKELKAVFDSNGRINADEASKYDICSKFLLRCGMGKINIIKY